MAGGEVIAHLFVKRKQADGVALLVQEPRERRGKGRAYSNVGVAEGAVSH